MSLAAPDAAAQTASPEDIAAARSLGTDGTRLADAGDCNGAIPKLESAEKLYHAPTTLDRLGECQIAVGKLVAGTEALNRVVREQLAPNPPAAFLAAKKRAQTALTAALPRIGSLKIHVDGAPADKLAITVDGAAVSSALLDADRPTDPGSHQVTVSATGYRTATSDVNVREGGESMVSLKLDVDPSAVAAVATPGTVEPGPVTPPPPQEPPPSGGGGAGRPLAYGALALGGAGLIVGGIFGGLALGNQSKLKSDCPKKICPAADQSTINAISTNSTVSTVAFGVGIVGVAVGVILLVVTSHHGETAAADPTKPHVSPWLTVGSAGVGGTFQ